MKICLAITTYNRLHYLRHCLESWSNTKDDSHDWHVVVADDGSKDGSIEYCESLGIKLIKHKRSGVHHQTNMLFRHFKNTKFDVCFKIDDDVYFKRIGWDNLFLVAMQESGYDHLVFHQNDRPRKFIKETIRKGAVEANTDHIHVLGCFYTITPKIIDEIGYFDIEHFGTQESGHVDYTRRCGKSEFNDPNFPFDAANSNEYIGLHWQHNDENYQHSISEHDRIHRRSPVDPILCPDNFTKFSDSRKYVPWKTDICATIPYL